MEKKYFLLCYGIFLAFGLSAQTYISVPFNQPPLLLASAGLDAMVCEGDTANLGGNPAGSGGTPAFTYFWSTSASITASNIANPRGFPSATASYILTVTDSRNCTASDTVVVTVEVCTSIKDANFPFSVSLFPNPNDGNFTIRFQGNGAGNPVAIQITNAIGQILEKRELPSFSGEKDELFNLPLTKGTYMVEIISGSKREIQKIVVR